MEKMNRMCSDCLKLGNGCKGTTCHIWTGCIYRVGKPYDNSYPPIKSIQGMKEKGVCIEKLKEAT